MVKVVKKQKPALPIYTVGADADKTNKKTEFHPEFGLFLCSQ